MTDHLSSSNNYNLPGNLLVEIGASYALSPAQTMMNGMDEIPERIAAFEADPRHVMLVDGGLMLLLSC